MVKKVNKANGFMQFARDLRRMFGPVSTEELVSRASPYWNMLPEDIQNKYKEDARANNEEIQGHNHFMPRAAQAAEESEEDSSDEEDGCNPNAVKMHSAVKMRSMIFQNRTAQKIDLVQMDSCQFPGYLRWSIKAKSRRLIPSHNGQQYAAANQRGQLMLLSAHCVEEAGACFAFTIGGRCNDIYIDESEEVPSLENLCLSGIARQIKADVNKFKELDVPDGLKEKFESGKDDYVCAAKIVAGGI